MNEFNVINSPLAGTNLIEASAGTGKTYAISVIFLRLLVENNFRIEDILVVTFTIPATMELRMRIRDRLRDAVNVIEGRGIDDKTIPLLMKKYKGDNTMKQRILTALKSFDQASVYTIHSFCQQILVDNAFESGSLFSSEIVNDDALIEQGVADLCRATLYNTSPALVSYFIDNCSPAELLELYKKRPLSPDLRIEPEDSDAEIESFEGCYNLVSELYKKLSVIWKKDRDSVYEIINREKFLNGRSYNKESNDDIMEQMDEYLSGDNPFAVFKKFSNFTSEKIRKSLNKGNEYPECEIFDICQNIFSAIENYHHYGSSFLISMKKRLFDVIDDLILYNKSMKSSRSFDDLIKDAHRGLGGKSGELLCNKVRGRYKAALIDEFQDTDSLQFDIFNNLFNNDKTILFLIGDPKQAIYRFRGADIFSYIKASQMMQNRYTLAHNWRSRTELIDCVNEVFSRCSDPFVFEKIQFYPVKPGDENQGPQLLENGNPLPPFDIWIADKDSVSGDDDLMERLTAEISFLISRDDDNPYMLGDRRISPGDIAVLVRTRKQGIQVRNAFARLSIPSVSRGMDNVFKTGEANELYFIVSAIAEPSNYNLVKSAASTIAMGGSAEVLFELSRESSGTAGKLDGLTSRFYEYREKWVSGGFLNMIADFLDSEMVPARLFALNGGERMVTNINHIAEILHETEHVNGYTPKELVSWFANTIASPPDDDEYAMRLERDDDAVNIVTMHACKGLEFPVVYCPFLAHQGSLHDRYVIYHDPADNDRPVMFLNNDVPEEVKSIKAREDLAENVRLLYVALTRAKSACRIMFAPNRNFSRSAAHYIFVSSPGYVKSADSNENLISAVNELAVNSGGRIVFSRGKMSQGRRYLAEKHETDKIAVREFTGEVRESWKTHSYSAIASHSASHAHETEKDYLSEFHPEPEKGDGIFGFAAGAGAGLCIHEIFEKTDFTLKDKKTVTEICGKILKKYRYDSAWDTHLADMFLNVVNSVLDENGLKLSFIDEKSRLSELEFNFPVAGFDSEQFRNVFRGGDIYSEKIFQRLSPDRSEPGGMMKGFMDLVFEYRGRYYIADWKSNHLGNHLSDYSPDRIIDEMEKHNYFLQYYIYIAALNRYLKNRLGSAYSYGKHFGGIYYFFIRGMNSENGSATGVFHDRPDESIIDKLDKYFAGVNI